MVLQGIGDFLTCFVLAFFTSTDSVANAVWEVFDPQETKKYWLNEPSYLCYDVANIFPCLIVHHTKPYKTKPHLVFVGSRYAHALGK